MSSVRGPNGQARFSPLVKFATAICQTVGKIIENLQEAAGVWFYRQSERISWIKHNNKVQKLVGIHCELVGNLRKTQLNFLGHIICARKLKYNLLTGKIARSKARGRTRTSLITTFTHINMRRVDFFGADFFFQRF